MIPHHTSKTRFLHLYPVPKLIYLKIYPRSRKGSTAGIFTAGIAALSSTGTTGLSAGISTTGTSAGISTTTSAGTSTGVSTGAGAAASSTLTAGTSTGSTETTGS